MSILVRGDTMEFVVIAGVGISVSLFRLLKFKKVKKTKKLRYYNYAKFEVKYRKINEAINEQSKAMFKR